LLALLHRSARSRSMRRRPTRPRSSRLLLLLLLLRCLYAQTVHIRRRMSIRLRGCRVVHRIRRDRRPLDRHIMKHSSSSSSSSTRCNRGNMVCRHHRLSLSLSLSRNRSSTV
ncbi:hypothetical protein EV175_007613, partial [Coemansia sp. RSA 1933]